MPEATATMDVRNAGEASVIDIRGDVTAGSEDVLMAAYDDAGEVSAIVLNFTELAYMNSGGIGLLVTLLVRANRQGQRLLAFGLSDHYRQIFELTRLDEAVGIHDTEADALAAGRREDLMSEVDEKAAARDATNWAKSVSRLERGRRAGGRGQHQRRRASGSRARSRASGRCGRRPTRSRLPAEQRDADRPDRHLEAALPGVLAGGQHVLRAADRDRPRRGRAAEHDAAGQDEALDGRDGPLRRRGVLHADDAGGAHVRRLDHLQRDRARR